MRFIVNGGGTQDPFRFEEGSTLRMLIDANGNVAIGNTTATEKLHVAGNINANGTIYSSDQKFKTNQQKINNALDVITKLEGKSYTYKVQEFPYMGFSAQKHYGFIAQEVEKILPDLVSNEKQSIPGTARLNDDGTGKKEDYIEYKGINYTELTPIIVEAIKEQQKQIEDLKKEIELLKQK
jgi:hypothetical protein